MIAKLQLNCLAASIFVMLSACGASDSGSLSGSAAPVSQGSVRASVAQATACPAVTLAATDAQTLTGDSTPLQFANYGTRVPGAPVLIERQALAGQLPRRSRAAHLAIRKHRPHQRRTDLRMRRGAERRLAQLQAQWQRAPAVVVTGGRNAAPENVYTVYNGQQLIAALKDAGLAPKIVRIVGHIDLRMSANNTVFKEYESYTDQKMAARSAFHPTPRWSASTTHRAALPASPAPRC
jgi:hypothetical protein